MRTAVLVGASSGVGRALSRRLAASGCDLVLVSRDERDLEASAADLTLRHGIRCFTVAQDIAETTWDVDAFAARCAEWLGGVDVLLVPAGGALDADDGPHAAIVEPVVATNFTGPARLAAAFGQRMQNRGSGQLVLFSSIAAAAPRSKNPAYSAAKAALEIYARGLRHALWRHGVRVLVVALGYVDTAQTFGRSLRLPLASPEGVADSVIRRLQAPPHGAGRIYYPRYWSLITRILGALPWFVYRRLRF